MRLAFSIFADARQDVVSLLLNVTMCIVNVTISLEHYCLAQAPTQNAGANTLKETPDESSLQRLIDEYAGFMDRFAAMQQSYRRIESVFQDTEKDFSLLQAESLKQQFSAAMTASAAMALASGDPLQNPFVRDNGPRLPRTQSGVPSETPAINTALSTLDAVNVELIMRTEQVRQLSAAQQAIVRKRAEAVQDLQKLQQDYVDWNAKWPSYFRSFWRFTDAECIRTDSENEIILAKLKVAPENNLPAKIAKSLLELRLDRKDDALVSINQALNQNTSLDAIAYSVRALIHIKKGGNSKANQDLQQAIKRAPNDHFVWWFRARFAVQRKDFGTAKKALMKLESQQDFEIAARRLLALLCTTGKERTAREVATGLDHATVASDLTGTEDWYSELVMAIAIHAAGNTKEAMSKAVHAKLLAQEKNIELCEKVITAIETQEKVSWDYSR
jgi:tetratricopeptide (TPR) repeat protein